MIAITFYLHVIYRKYVIYTSRYVMVVNNYKILYFTIIK